MKNKIRFVTVLAAGLAAAALRSEETGYPALDLRDLENGPAAIVYGEGLESLARELEDACRETLGAEFPIVFHREVMAPGTWRIGEPWASRPLILLGNIANNEAIFSLYSRYLEGVNAAWPGPGRYVLRAVFQPFRRGAHLLVVGGSDAEGARAGAARFRALLGEHGGRFGPTLELGGIGGVDAPPSSAPPSKMAAPTAFPDAVTQFYWRADHAAGQKARELLLGEMETRERGLFWNLDANSHYQWEKFYRPLRQLQVSGLLTADEERRVDERLLANALDTTDDHAVPVRARRVGTLGIALTRHYITALTGLFMLTDYLVHVGHAPEERRDELRRAYEHVLGHYESLVEQEIFHSATIFGTEGAETQNLLADLYLYFADRRVVEKGLFRRMADFNIAGKDNLGWYAGGDSYISSKSGSHLARSAGGNAWLFAGFFHRDGQYRWMLENQHAFLTHFTVARPPKSLALLDAIKPVEPSRFYGVSLQPMERVWYERGRSRAADEIAVPIDAPYERTFAWAAFRERFDPDAAYLLVQGMDTGSLSGNYAFHGNAITRYTELGSILLFDNSMRHTGWSKSLVSVSRGEPDPQSTASVVETAFSSKLASGLQSTRERHGGTRWTRSILRRHGGYFVVFDRLEALENDTYNFTCRWRSFHPGARTADGGFEAIDGLNQVRFRIESATPEHWTVETEPQDGATRPTMVRQFRRQTMKAGRRTGYRNLLYATGPRHVRDLAIRAVGDTAALVTGRTETFEERALAGVEGIRLGPIEGDAALWYASVQGLVCGGVRRLRIEGWCHVESVEAFNLELRAAGAGWIENPGGSPITLDWTLDPGVRVRIDGQDVKSAFELSPGRHALETEAAPALFARLATALEAASEDAAPADAIEMPDGESESRFHFSPAWRHEGVLPRYVEHADIRVHGEPEPDIGQAATWRNRLVGPPSGYGWHGSERCGWSPGTEGAIVMDMGAEIDLVAVRLIRSRRVFTEIGAFNPGEFSFEVVLSNDGFEEDVRTSVVPGEYGIYHLENAQYTYTRRFPQFIVPIRARARYIKLIARRVIEVSSPPGDYYGTYRDGEISFMDVAVFREEREPRRSARLWAVSAGDSASFLYQAGGTLRLLDPDGRTRWTHTLEAPPAALTQIADLDGTGRNQVLYFSLAEILTGIDVASGAIDFRLDINERSQSQPQPAGIQRLRHRPGMLDYRPNAFAVWRPDVGGRREIAIFPHYCYIRIGPGPERIVYGVRHPTHLWRRGGKFAFPVPDVTGDGIEELAVVGLYGLGFGVVPSDAPLEEGRLPKHLVSAQLTGYSSGNMELQLYFDGAVVRSTQGEWLGTVALNPGGVDFFSAPDFRKTWSRFHHPNNLCFVQADLDGNGVPEILVGREDGYVLAYRAEDGSLFAKTALDGAVRALAACEQGILAGTERGLALLDRELRPLAYRPGPVEDVAVARRGGGGEIVGVALTEGAVFGLTIGAAKPWGLPFIRRLLRKIHGLIHEE
jgi:hypothetical protein